MLDIIDVVPVYTAEMEGIPWNEAIVEVNHLKKHYTVRGGVIDKILIRKQKYVRAVDDISFVIRKGETFGLVGESGCGKSTLGRCVLRLESLTAGNIKVFEQNIHSLSDKQLKSFRKQAQVVFQDPYSSLPPHKTLENMLKEVVAYHKTAQGDMLKEYCRDLLDRVGLSETLYTRRPRALSGGQRQRAAIARALATEPKFIVLDEPVTALDISVQAQILNLLVELQKERDLTYLFIAHDLSVIRHVSDTVGVMYLGKLVELAPSKELFEKSLHPYTKSLMSSSPLLSEVYEIDRVELAGEVPSPIDLPVGCRFHTRCPFASSRCGKEEPKLTAVNSGHFVSCFLATQ